MLARTDSGPHENPQEGGRMGESAAAVRRAKSALRSRLLAGRGTLPGRATGDSARTAALLGDPVVRAAKTVAAYASFGLEPDTVALCAQFATRGTRVLIPQLVGNGQLRFRTPAGELYPLAAADVVLVPALAVDRAGRRLGRGGGGYDRVLGTVVVPILALLHPGELLARVPTEPHDQPITGVALPGGIAWLGARPECRLDASRAVPHD